MSCRRSLDLVLLWLWYWPAVTAPIWPLVWELLYTTGGPKKTNKVTICLQYISLSAYKHIKITLPWPPRFIPKSPSTPQSASYMYMSLKLELPAYTTATAMEDPSGICDLHHSLWQYHILNLLSEARDWTRILMDTSQLLNLLSHNWNSHPSTYDPELSSLTHLSSWELPEDKSHYLIQFCASELT